MLQYSQDLHVVRIPFAGVRTSIAPQALKATYPKQWDEVGAVTDQSQGGTNTLSHPTETMLRLGQTQLYSPSWGTDFPLLLKLQRRFTDLI